MPRTYSWSEMEFASKCSFIFLSLLIAFWARDGGRAPASSCVRNTSVAVCSFWITSMNSYTFGCAFPTTRLRRLCHPSRWLLVLKESFWYTLHCCNGKFPTNHVSSKYWTNSWMRGSGGAAALMACQAKRTKRTGTNAKAAVLCRNRDDFR